MGCFASRFDRRNDSSGDFNTVQAAFLGGKDAELFDNFPVDRVLAALDLAKEPADLVAVEEDLKLTNEEQTTEIFKGARTFLRDHFKVMTSEYGSPTDAKDVFVGDKYKAKDALEQIQATIDHLQTSSGIADDAPAADAAPAEAMAMEGEMMMEGGDEMMGDMAMEAMAMEGSMQAPNPFAYDKDERKYEGWDQVGLCNEADALFTTVGQRRLERSKTPTLGSQASEVGGSQAHPGSFPGFNANDRPKIAPS